MIGLNSSIVLNFRGCLKSDCIIADYVGGVARWQDLHRKACRCKISITEQVGVNIGHFLSGVI